MGQSVDGFLAGGSLYGATRLQKEIDLRTGSESHPYLVWKAIGSVKLWPPPFFAVEHGVDFVGLFGFGRGLHERAALRDSSRFGSTRPFAIGNLERA